MKDNLFADKWNPGLFGLLMGFLIGVWVGVVIGSWV